MSSAFENEMISSSDFEATVSRDLHILAAPASQRLYRDVAMVRRWSQDRTSEVEEGRRGGEDKIIKLRNFVSSFPFVF